MCCDGNDGLFGCLFEVIEDYNNVPTDVENGRMNNVAKMNYVSNSLVP